MFDFLKKKISSWIGKEDKKKSSKKQSKKERKVSKSKKTEKRVKTAKKESKSDIKPEKKIQVEITEEAVVKDTEDIKEVEKEVDSKLLTKSEKETKAEVDEILEEAENGPKTEQVEEKIEVEEKGNFFTKLFKKITTAKLSQEDFNTFFEEFEITLLENNVALEAVDKIKEKLSNILVGQQIKKPEAEARILQALKDAILSVLIEPPNLIKIIKEHEGIYTIIFFGINGTGKTTSIAKLANMLKKENISCLLAAGDTFRAASIEQLKIHGERLQIPVIASTYNADPASVAFDAIKYAQAHKIKVVLIDTAGRMYTKANLLKEMDKIIRISKPNLKIFVGESITGNDAIEQAKTFNESIGIDGIILSKADVDEKAGTILSVSHITGKPIYFLGIGQNYDDLLPFTKKVVLKNLGL